MIDKIFVILLYSIILFVDILYFWKCMKFNPVSIGYRFYCFIILISIFIDNSGNYFGLYLIMIFFVFSYFGLFISKYIKVNKKGRRFFFNINKMRCIIIILIYIIVPITIYYAITKGFNIKDILNLNKMFEINEVSAYNRYNGIESSKVVGILLYLKNFLIYIVALLSGIYFALSKKRKELLPFIIFFISIFELLLSNGKLGLIITTILFMIGIFLIYPTSLCDKKILKKKNKQLLILVVCVILFLYLSMLLRVGSIDLKTQIEIQQKFLNYAFGSIYAFNNWIVNNIKDIGFIGLGTETFTGVLNMLGLVTRVQGVYKTLFKNGIWNTNVYTAFRGIFSDFGIAGFCILAIMCGFISGYYYKKKKNNGSIDSFVGISMMYLFYLYSFIISPFVYSSLTFVIPISFFCLKEGNKIKWKKIKFK